MVRNETRVALRILSRFVCISIVVGLGYLMFLVRASGPDEKQGAPESDSFELRERPGVVEIEKSIVVHDDEVSNPGNMWALIDERDALKEENAKLEAEIRQLQTELEVARSSVESAGSGQPASLLSNTELLEDARIERAAEELAKEAQTEGHRKGDGRQAI